MFDVDILADVAVGNDKTFTVAAPDTAQSGPRERVHQLLYGVVDVTTTATVGNRQITISVEDGSGNVLWSKNAAGTIAASQTNVLTFLGEDPTFPHDRMAIPQGALIRVADSAAIDALDTFVVRLAVAQWLAPEV